MTTLFIITDFVILTLEPITQFFPMTDLEMMHLSPIVVPSPITTSENLNNLYIYIYKTSFFYFFSLISNSLFFVAYRHKGGGFKNISRFP